MEPVLSNRPTVNPPLIINRNSNFSESESMSGVRTDSKDDAANAGEGNDGQVVDDGDPFVTGAAYRSKGKKRRRTIYNGIVSATYDMKDALQEKWVADKEREDKIRAEERKYHEQEMEKSDKLLNTMEKNVKSMNTLNNILQILV